MQSDGGLRAERVYVVSCPACDQEIELAPAVEPGDTLTCCHHTYRVTLAYGAYALEPA